MERFLRLKLKTGRFESVNPTRSRIMSSIRGKSNRTTEQALRLALVRNGLSGWKLHPSDILGRPDFFFPKHRLAVFVDGCFWHGCPKCGHTPNTRRAFWKAKIRRNRERDALTSRRLRADGIRVLRIWEHELGDPRGLASSIARITTHLVRS